MKNKDSLNTLREFVGVNKTKSLRGFSRCCDAKCTVIYKKPKNPSWEGQLRGRLHCTKCKKICKRYQHKGETPYCRWNPMENWNDWRMVEEVIMRDKELMERFMMHFSVQSHHPYSYFVADLPTRCEAIVSIIKEYNAKRA